MLIKDVKMEEEKNVFNPIGDIIKLYELSEAAVFELRQKARGPGVREYDAFVDECPGFNRFLRQETVSVGACPRAEEKYRCLGEDKIKKTNNETQPYCIFRKHARTKEEKVGAIVRLAPKVQLYECNSVIEGRSQIASGCG